MATHKEQAMPLAPATIWQSSSDGGGGGRDHEAAPAAMCIDLKKKRQRRYIKCCGCITALILILFVTVLVLSFTVFHIKDPSIKMNSVNIQGLQLATLQSGTGANVTVIANISIKNPNVATFKFSNTTTSVYYHGAVVGEARHPPGRAKARRTLKMNVTVDIISQKILAVPELPSDLRSGALSVDSYTRVDGRVKILKIFKKHVVVEMNCTITVNITSQAIREQRCKYHVDL